MSRHFGESDQEQTAAVDIRGDRLEYGGAGLGLAITKRIMELHGSEIGVQSSAGQGTCFTLRLRCCANRAIN